MRNKISIILLVFVSAAYAKDLSSKHSIPILYQTSARSKGMMDAVFVNAHDSSTIFMNPSMMMALIRDSLNISYALDQTSLNDGRAGISYAHIENSYAIGASFAGNFTKFQKYNGIGNHIGSSINGQYLASIAGAFSINGVFIGGNLKAIVNNEGKNTDWGALLDVSYMQSVFVPALKVGIGIRNFGFYQNTFAMIDTDLIAAIGFHREDGTLSLSVQYGVSLPSLSQNIAVGAEIMVVNFKALGINFSKKNNNLYDVPESVLDEPTELQRKRNAPIPSGLLARFGVGNKGASLGFSFYIDFMRLDYAVTFNNFSADNISHDIGLGFMF